MRRPLAIAVTALAITTLTLPGAAEPAQQTERGFGRATLTTFAALPAETYVPASEPSGAALGTTPVNGIQLPFADQPVQGFSGIVRNQDGTFEVLSDNGYGTKANSADFALGLHRIAPNGTDIDVLGGIDFTDPDHKVPFPLTRPDRVLTGADFDVESIVRAKDNTYWVGDEFGPYLLHFDRTGRLLAAPVPLPGVFAPENPSGTPNLPSSKGFEGLAISPDRRTLNALLEGTVAGDPAGSLRLNEFDIARDSYTGKRWTYQLDDPSHAIGDLTTVDRDRLLVIERDGFQGADAKVKKVYLVDKRDRDHDGKLDKTLVADLLDLANPRHLGGFDETFRFPFQTIEDVAVLDDRTLAILNDNNFPFSSGRNPGKPDNDEFITVRLSQSLHPDPRSLHD
ncbi:esterase-like activity of phytase family protein [Actinokineospora enzanensis]|uniref:esterase-like activity of phytase family protein n=1 Tax=Actinokineospora enzanensis TaxID=155975 RepID=UPI00047678A5|nr:esterase-like activity of phytase family protein [Actinokineospora enzanensis]